jgi:hypothetical protein
MKITKRTDECPPLAQSGHGAQGEDRGLRIQLGQLGDIRSNPPRLIAREPQ